MSARVDPVHVVAPPPTWFRNTPDTARVFPVASAKFVAAAMVKLAVVVAFPEKVKVPPVVEIVTFANDVFPGATVRVPEEVLKVTVPEPGTNTAAFENDPPIVKVPDGSVVVPALNTTSPNAVAFVSVRVNTPAFCTKRFESDDPPSVTVRLFNAEVILSVPPLATNAAPEFTKSLPTSSTPDGKVGVPERIESVFEVVAFVSKKLHAPPDPSNTRSKKGEPPTRILFPVNVAYIRTVPEL